MNISLITFLAEGKIAGVRVGLARQAIVELLGLPKYWEGHPEVSAEASEIWLYGPLQLNYDSDQKVETIRFHFRHHVVNLTATLKMDFSPFEIRESIPGDLGELQGFEAFLTDHGVPFSRSKNEIGQTIVRCGRSSVTKFYKHSDDTASMAAGKPIFVPGELIASCSVSSVE